MVTYDAVVAVAVIAAAIRGMASSIGIVSCEEAIIAMASALAAYGSCHV